MILKIAQILYLDHDTKNSTYILYLDHDTKNSTDTIFRS